MAAKDLISLARAYQELPGVSNQDALLSTLITAVSDAITKYCRRHFLLTNYDEVYSGSGTPRLLLRHYPLQAVQSVRYRLTTVLQITSTGLLLTSVTGGLRSQISSLTWASFPTLQALASAVNALGNGWNAQVVGSPSGDYGQWPSADLYVPPAFGDGTQGQGALPCAAGTRADLKMHTAELQGYYWDARGWLLRAFPYTDPELGCPEDLLWPVGINNFRVQYTAGYTTVPEAVQEACARWVARLFYQTQRDPTLTLQSLSGTLTQRWNNSPRPDPEPPEEIRTLLAPYRRYSALIL
jgi:hypothetical protein